MYYINIWTILVASVVAFGIGALWYSPILFAKEWMAYTKTTEADVAIAKAKGMWKSYIIHFIGNFLSFFILAFIASAAGISSGAQVAFFGFLIWLGFVLPVGISDILWKKTPVKLVLIDTVNVLLGLVIGGGIIGAWQ